MMPPAAEASPRPQEPVFRARLHCVAPFADLSGAPISALNHAAWLGRDFAEACLCLPGPGPVAERARAQGVCVCTWAVANRGLRGRFFRKTLWADLRAVLGSRRGYFRALSRSLREMPGVVHVHSSLSVAPLALRAARFCRAPAVLHVRETARTGAERLRLGLLAVLATSVVCVSEAVRQAGGRLQRRKARVIHNFLPLPAEPAAGGRSPPRLALVGRMTWAKGPDLFIRMCAGLRTAGVPFDAWLVGDWRFPAERAQAAALIAELQLESRVQIRDLERDMDALYRQVDILVLPTRRDSFPRVIMEAMGQGLPVVATRIDGTPEMVDEGRTGFLTAAEDVPALTAAVRRLAEDPELRRSLGAAGRARAQRLFSPEAYRAAMLDLYRDSGVQP